MDIKEALEIVLHNKLNLILSRHAYDKTIKEKGRFLETIEIINNNLLLGIVEQRTFLYKLWFYYTDEKDLNAIILILPNHSLLCITFFQCNSLRRKR